MLAVSVLFAPGLLAFLMLAGALECYLLKRPEERAAQAAEQAPDPPAEPEPAPPVPAEAEPPMPEGPPGPAAPAPFPIPAHLPGVPGAAALHHPGQQAGPIAD